MRRSQFLLAYLMIGMAASIAWGATQESAPRWYRGNTHTHTVLGDGNSSPEVVAKWYLDHGYNFLCLSEHNRYIDPKTVKMPADKRSDFVLIPAEEVTGKKVHVTGLNTDGAVDPSYVKSSRKENNTAAIEGYIKGVEERKGEVILNHPYYKKWLLKSDEIIPIKRLRLFEVYNAGYPSNNFGNATHDSTEVIWDKLLTAGKVMYGVAADDAHDFQTVQADKTNPGRAWVMVRSDKLTAAAITEAMCNGDFYATGGVMLKDVSTAGGLYTVETDEPATLAELKKGTVVGREAKGAAMGWQIEFIGPQGKVLQSTRTSRASFPITKDNAYIRCKVTFVRNTSIGSEAYYAWTQPLFPR